MNLILASKSPRRAKILTDTGYNYTAIESDFDENTIPLSSTSIKSVELLALGKAKAVFAGLPSVAKLDTAVLGADTIVVCDEEVLQKPKTEKEAEQMLFKLSGRKHTVYTAVALVTAQESTIFTEETDVYFHQLTEEMVKAYVATKEPMDKAGAYGIQGRGALLVEKIDGDYFNVVGLPISKVAKKLAEYDVKPSK